MKYVILSDSDNIEPFKIPRQLTKINGEELVVRTIRLLKENGVNDIIITSHDKRFDGLGAKRYEPKYNDYRPKLNKGYWVSAFPIELLNEPICFLLGDVYYSENAIKTIVKSETKTILYFCSYKNQDKRYIKRHDEPFGFKVVDYVMFKEHIERIKAFKDSGKALREPISWELYRSINNQPIKEHKMTDNYIAINDESCDIDCIEDIYKLKERIGDIKMMKVKAITNFTLERYDELKNIQRVAIDTKGRLYPGDIFECNEEIGHYLLGENDKGIVAVELIEIMPEEKVNELGNPVGTRKLEKELAGFDSVSELSVEEKPKKKRTKKNLQSKQNVL